MSSLPAPQLEGITGYSIAERFIGLGELPGNLDNPHIRSWLADCGFGPEAHDETPWCAAFVRYVAWLFDLPIPHFPARARSWLTVGEKIEPKDAVKGWDIVILARSAGPWPGPELLSAPGHVGWFDHIEGNSIYLLGGNQHDHVSLAPFPIGRLLGIRRLRGA